MERKAVDHSEAAKAIEGAGRAKPQPTHVPIVAVGSIVASATFNMAGVARGPSLPMGGPTFLILGLYNKLVEQLGSDDLYPAS
jgi:hypothetical protein